MVRSMEGHGFLITRKPPPPGGTSTPSRSTIAARMPGKGLLADPGFVGTPPGTGEGRRAVARGRAASGDAHATACNGTVRAGCRKAINGASNAAAGTKPGVRSVVKTVAKIVVTIATTGATITAAIARRDWPKGRPTGRPARGERSPCPPDVKSREMTVAYRFLAAGLGRDACNRKVDLYERLRVSGALITHCCPLPSRHSA